MVEIYSLEMGLTLVIHLFYELIIDDSKYKK